MNNNKKKILLDLIFNMKAACKNLAIMWVVVATVATLYCYLTYSYEIDHHWYQSPGDNTVVEGAAVTSDNTTGKISRNGGVTFTSFIQQISLFTCFTTPVFYGSVLLLVKKFPFLQNKSYPVSTWRALGKLCLRRLAICLGVSSLSALLSSIGGKVVVYKNAFITVKQRFSVDLCNAQISRIKSQIDSEEILKKLTDWSKEEDAYTSVKTMDELANLLQQKLQEFGCTVQKASNLALDLDHTNFFASNFWGGEYTTFIFSAGLVLLGAGLQYAVTKICTTGPTYNSAFQEVISRGVREDPDVVGGPDLPPQSKSLHVHVAAHVTQVDRLRTLTSRAVKGKDKITFEGHDVIILPGVQGAPIGTPVRPLSFSEMLESASKGGNPKDPVEHLTKVATYDWGNHSADLVHTVFNMRESCESMEDTLNSTLGTPLKGEYGEYARDNIPVHNINKGDWHLQYLVGHQKVLSTLVLFGTEILNHYRKGDNAPKVEQAVVDCLDAQEITNKAISIIEADRLRPVPFKPKPPAVDNTEIEALVEGRPTPEEEYRGVWEELGEADSDDDDN